MEKWYDSSIAQGILKSKYYHVNEKEPQEFMDRVTSIFSPEIRTKMRTYLEDGAVCPAGRTLYAAGAKGKFKGSLSNCYILPSPEDNIESIFLITLTACLSCFSKSALCGQIIQRMDFMEVLNT